MKASFEETAKDLLRSAFVNRNVVVLMFALVSLGVMGLGLIWPPKYVSFATVLVEERNIIEPLMAGTAVATGVRDHARIAREVIFARRNVDELLKYGGWLDQRLSQLELEKIGQRIEMHTQVSMVGDNLLRVEYYDSDPERAHRLTERMVDIFITQSLAAKEKESERAFAFIDKQVEEYEATVAAAKQRLDEFRAGNRDAWAGTKEQVATRIDTLSRTIDQTSLELKEARIRQASLEKQLSGEAGVVASLSREGQLTARVAELQSQLDVLRLSYRDSYPDVVRLRHQIEDLKQAIAEEDKQSDSQGGSSQLEKGVTVNPLYQQLRSELSESRAAVDTLSARLEETQAMLDKELQRAQRIQALEPRLAELTRDYEVNRNIYQDLLKRRENARVSMNLDQERQGLTLKVQEPAFRPLQPTGLRFVHFLIIGLPLGVLLPLGLVYGVQQVDPRVRFKSTIVGDLNLPLLASLPHFPSPWERRLVRLHLYVLGLLVVGVIAAYSWVAWAKLTGAI